MAAIVLILCTKCYEDISSVVLKHSQMLINLVNSLVS